METISLIQGSPEWHQHRATHFNASDAPAMLGISPYKTRAQLVAEYATGSTQEVDVAMQMRFDNGHRFERLARPLAEEIVGDELYPVVGKEGIYSASFDGITMDESIIFEHKTINDTLREVAKTGAPIPPMYLAQIEHQLMVSGAEKCLFMASWWGPDDELIEELQWWWVESTPALRYQIIAGWEQFKEDVANYQHVEEAPKLEGVAPESLPALHIEVTGMVTHSNLKEFREHALSVIGSINTDLQTDEDFANAEKTVKWCADVEKRIESAKDSALAQTASIDELFRMLDAIKQETRAKRLNLNNLVKTRKDAIRGQILASAKEALSSHLEGLNERLGRNHFSIKTFLMSDGFPPDFAGAMKSKKAIKSLRDGVDQVLADAKIYANQIADGIQINLKELQILAADFKFLFSDIDHIISKPHDDFVATVKLRIADHKEAKAKEEQAQRARIERDERAKIEAEARQKAEQERQEHARVEAEEREQKDAAAWEQVKTQQPVFVPETEDKTTGVERLKRPSDAEIVRAVADVFGVDDKTAWGWLENFGQEDAA